MKILSLILSAFILVSCSEREYDDCDCPVESVREMRLLSTSPGRLKPYWVSRYYKVHTAECLENQKNQKLNNLKKETHHEK